MCVRVQASICVMISIYVCEGDNDSGCTHRVKASVNVCVKVCTRRVQALIGMCVLVL